MMQSRTEHKILCAFMLHDPGKELFYTNTESLMSIGVRTYAPITKEIMNNYFNQGKRISKSSFNLLLVKYFKHCNVMWFSSLYGEINSI